MQGDKKEQNEWRSHPLHTKELTIAADPWSVMMSLATVVVAIGYQKSPQWRLRAAKTEHEQCSSRGKIFQKTPMFWEQSTEKTINRFDWRKL